MTAYDLMTAQNILMDRRRNLPPAPIAVAELVTAVSEPAPAADIEEISPQAPPRVTLAQLDRHHPLITQAIEMCYRWRDEKQNGRNYASIVLTGPYGSGKTHIALALLWSMALTLDSGEPVAPAGRFFKATDLLMKMNPTKTDYGSYDIPRPSDFIGYVPILVIDDIGTEQRLPFITGNDQDGEIAARYYRVIDYCYSKNISVIITCNTSLKELARIIGGRAWDRLQQMAPRGFMMDLAGVPSWRQMQSGRQMVGIK